MDRDLDLVLYGATGFVGLLTARHLATTAPSGVRIGLAGRNEAKLADVRQGLGPAAADWPLLHADSGDEASLTAAARRTRVMVTTVGPYAQHGLPLVKACAEAGTHYADLTGEIFFVRRAIDDYHAVAEDSGARIVVSCGFDSVPSDLGVLTLHEAVQADGAGELGDTTLLVGAFKGGFSGGTVASLRGHLAELKGSRESRRLGLDPYALAPDPAEEADLGRQSDFTQVGRERESGEWQAPFLMASYNTRVVRRTNALLGHPYGKSFRYSEAMGFGGGAKGALVSAGVTAGLAVAGAGLALAPGRLLDRIVPAPGTGPSEAVQEKGFFSLAIHTGTTTGAHYVARVAAKGDPGYAATAVMLGQSALALAHDTLPERAGVLTPASGIGGALADRLRAQGFTLTAGPV